MNIFSAFTRFPYNRTAAIALGLLCAHPFQSANAADMISKLSGEQLAGLMQDWGYKAALSEDDYGDPMISTATSGAQYKVYFYDCSETQPKSCDNLMLSAGFIYEDDLEPGIANQWNLNNRYGRAYIDEEGDPILERDISLTGGVSEANLKEQFRIWDDSLGDFLTVIDW